MIWLLLACTQAPDTESTPSATESEATEETDASEDTGAAPAVFQNPAEAVDESDDPGFQLTLVADEATLEVGSWTQQGYAYNGQTPGPTIRVQRGDTVEITLQNDLDVPTTIHWHGLHVPYDMDGVTWSQAPVQPGERYVYTFTVDQVGTYWYHPHFDTEHQVDAGLYGAFIVEDPDAPAVDDEWVLVLDDWEPPGDTASDGLTGAGEHGQHDHTEWTWTVNGLRAPTLPATTGETVLVRVINTSNAGYVDLDASAGLTRVGSDQGWLPAQDDIAAGEGHVLSPGDRADLMWTVQEGEDPLLDLPFSAMGGETWETEPDTLLTVVGSGSTTGATPDWPFTGGTVTEDPGNTDLRYTFQGDSTAGTWMINGETFPDVTVPTLAEGDEVVVEVRNVSATRHPFHLHGHYFEVLSVDGEPPAMQTLEDTWDLGRYETVRLRFTANNVGSWMTHCHILPHADGGMMTVIDVESSGDR